MRLFKAIIRNHLVCGSLWALIGGYGIGLLFLALSVANQRASLLAVVLLVAGLVNLALHHGASSNGGKNFVLVGGLIALMAGVTIALAVGIRAFGTVVGVLGLILLLRYLAKRAAKAINPPKKKKKES